MNKLEYIAGIVDSESYFRMRKTKTSKVNGVDFCLQMTDREPIDYLVRNYGATYSYEIRGKDRKSIYTARLGKYNILPFINDLLPYLNEKYIQAKKIKEYLELSKDMQMNYADEAYNLFIKLRYTSSMRFFSLDYLAGIIDGDGWITLFNDKRETLIVSIGLELTFDALPIYLYKKYGGNLHFKVGKKSTHRNTVSWRISTIESLKLLKEVQPFLILKKHKADFILSLYRDIEEKQLEIKELKNEAKDKFVKLFKYTTSI
jgi:hypothetical protein